MSKVRLAKKFIYKIYFIKSGLTIWENNKFKGLEVSI
jgi:hypothetical protein